MFKNKRFLVVALSLVVVWLLPDAVGAAPLTQAGVRLGRLSASASTNNDMLVTFKLFNATSVAKIVVTFPASGGTGFTLSGTPTVLASTYTFPNTPTGISPLTGTLTPSLTSGGAGNGGTITVATTATLNTTTLYGFDIPTGVITDPSVAGQYNVSVTSETSGNTPVDTLTTPVDIVSSGGDQVTVNASVAANFSFSLSTNTDTVPAVDPTSIQTSPGINMVVGTNSPLGYTAYVASAGSGTTGGPAELKSASTSGTIPSGTFSATTPQALTVGTTNYTFVPSTNTPACTTCSGTITYDGAYNIVDGTHGGNFNTANNFASFVSRNSYTNDDTIKLQERVTVSPAVPPANDYTDTLTIIAAGNY